MNQGLLTLIGALAFLLFAIGWLLRGSQRRARKSRLLFKEEDAEGYQLGPIRLERHGRLVTMKSLVSPESGARFRKKLLKKRPKLKRLIAKKISTLRKGIQGIHKAHLLGELALYNLVLYGQEESTEEYSGPTIIDYILSVALAGADSTEGRFPTEEEVTTVQRLAREIFMLSSAFSGMELADDSLDPKERDLRFFMMQRQLLTRGNAYAGHELDTVVDILKPLDDVLLAKFKFRSTDIRELVESSYEQFRAKLTADVETMAKLKRAHELFKVYCDETKLGKGMSEEQFRAGYESLPEVRTILKECRSHTFRSGLELCEVVPNNEAQAELLALLSCSFGDNRAFLEGEWSGWPLNDSIITSKLFVSFNGKYYCIARHALSYCLRDAIEGLIQAREPALFNKRYEPARNDYLEATTLNYLATALPGCRSYRNLYYTIEESGTSKRCELDGLVLFDTALILVEAKAGTLSVPARRGSVSRLRKDITSLVEKPFTQCLRARQFIIDNDGGIFLDGSNKELCRVDRASISELYMITATLDSLGPISGDLNSVRQLGLASGSDWFWSVAVHDLRIITELSEFPTQFIHYLQRRIRINTQPKVKSIDEVDLFGVYLTEGLFFEDWELASMGIMSFNGYTDGIDDYYYRTEAGEKAEKPRQQIPDSFKQMIFALERTGKPGFLDVTLALLDMDGPSREEFAKRLEERIADVRSGGVPRDFTMLFEPLSKGISVVILGSLSRNSTKRAVEYCERKKRETQMMRWFCLVVGVKGPEPMIDFTVLK